MAGGKKGPNSEVSKTFFCPLPPYSPPPPPPHAVGVYINCQAFTQLSNVMTPHAPSTPSLPPPRRDIHKTQYTHINTSI